MKIKNALFVLSALFLSGTAMADVCFYEHANFGGRELCMGDGQRIFNLRDMGWNDTISSIRLRGRGGVRVCTDAGFSGRCEMIERDIYNLDAIGLNDAISSVETVRGWGGGDGHPESRDVCFYRHAGYVDRLFCLNAGDEIVDLNNSGYNDQISSIQVRPGVSVTVCSDAYFRGACQRIGREVSHLGALGFNDTISSVRVDYWGRGRDPGRR